jgi:hypothetical protein
MNRITFIIAALLFAAAAQAADAMPPLLADSATLKAPTRVGTPACETPPPAPAAEPPASPAPATTPSAPVAACPAPPAPSAVAACPAPASGPVFEVVAVPVKKRVVVEECYVANVRRTGTYDEVRTRTRKKSVDVVATKLVSEAKFVEVASVSGNSVRLARGVSRSVVPTVKKEIQEYEESYVQPIRYAYTEAVPKTRKVAKYVDDVEIVKKRVR